MKVGNRKGFTLVEAIVVSVLMAILAAVAIPAYSSYVKSAKVDTAKSMCELIAAAVMHQHNRGVDISASSWSDIGITNPSDDNWTYTFSALAASSAMSSSWAVSVTGTGTGSYKPKAGSKWTGVLN